MMDLTSFKLDIDDLLDEFSQGKYTTLADMKTVWMTMKFSYIYQAKPAKKVIWLLTVTFPGDWVDFIAFIVFMRHNRTSLASRSIYLLRN